LGFGFGHRGVSSLEQLTLVFPVLRVDACVNTDVHSNSAIVHLGRRRKCRNDFAEHLCYADAIISIDQNQPELVPSEPRHRVNIAHAVVKTEGDVLQQRVTDEASEPVADRFCNDSRRSLPTQRLRRSVPSAR
jgi:hypothetical protein